MCFDSVFSSYAHTFYEVMALTIIFLHLFACAEDGELHLVQQRLPNCVMNVGSMILVVLVPLAHPA